MKTVRDFIPTIGLEVHIELKTRTKMFCDCLNDSSETRSNVNICPICVGHPGALPVINRAAVEAVIKTGLAVGSEISSVSKFDRKNYFYPDLPKGYQISQYDAPLCSGGFLEIPEPIQVASLEKTQIPSSQHQANSRPIRIRRIHLEEDTGKNMHPVGEAYSLVDFNRAGVPLMELVTEPDIHSAKDARSFAEELQLLIRYLNVSGADMEKGELRLEANISVNKSETTKNGNNGLKELGTKVEIKNLNSFRALEDAISYEIERQIEALNGGVVVKQETRGWDDVKKSTYSQRDKEESRDYRYFPEPDLPPIRITDGQASSVFASGLNKNEIKLEKIHKEIPELPWQKRLRLVNEYGLEEKRARALVEEIEYADFFEHAVSEIEKLVSLRDDASRKKFIALIYNYLFSDLKGLMATAGALSLAYAKVNPRHFARLIFLVQQGKLSSRGAKETLKKMFETGTDAESVAREQNLAQVSDVVALRQIALEVIEKNPRPVADYKKGKIEALQFLKGQMMAKTKGAANPQATEGVLKQIIHTDS